MMSSDVLIKNIFNLFDLKSIRIMYIEILIDFGLVVKSYKTNPNCIPLFLAYFSVYSASKVEDYNIFE